MGKDKLVLLRTITNDLTKELSEEEIDLREKLVEIETKLKSVEKVITNIAKDSKTIYDSEAFSLLIESIAITSAISVVAEYLNVSPEDIEELLK